jgi:NAD(P)-dependent dehydrogenase (short-subunit alcohol dehydrogenase family)
MNDNGNPPQHQDRQPGLEHEMRPAPEHQAPWYVGSGKLEGRRAIITGGDSGIGRAVAQLFAREGADVAIVYLDEHTDAKRTAALVEGEGRSCVLIAGDLGDVSFAEQAVTTAVDELGGLDIVVSNAAEQHVAADFADVSAEQVERTFRTNVFGTFNVVRAALPHLGDGSAIIATTSVTAYQGNPVLVDYSSTKGAIVSFTRALSTQLAERGIRVNAVAPGPVWTPLIPASFDEEHVESFGQSVPLGRPGQPEEIAPSYVFLAARDSSYMTGQVLHPNGGKVIGA